MNEKSGETYLCDGLYASFDGHAICLRAPRLDGNDIIYLDPQTYRALFDFGEACAQQSQAEFEKWIKERDEALRTLDISFARRDVPDASDEVLSTVIHMARYLCTSIEAALRLESGEYLRAHGITQIDGIELLPPGELPK